MGEESGRSFEFRYILVVWFQNRSAVFLVYTLCCAVCYWSSSQCFLYISKRSIQNASTLWKLVWGLKASPWLLNYVGELTVGGSQAAPEGPVWVPMTMRKAPARGACRGWHLAGVCCVSLLLWVLVSHGPARWSLLAHSSSSKQVRSVQSGLSLLCENLKINDGLPRRSF